MGALPPKVIWSLLETTARYILGVLCGLPWPPVARDLPRDLLNPCPLRKDPFGTQAIGSNIVYHAEQFFNLCLSQFTFTPPRTLEFVVYFCYYFCVQIL